MVAVSNYPELSSEIDEILASTQMELSDQSKLINVRNISRKRQNNDTTTTENHKRSKQDEESAQITTNNDQIDSTDDSITLYHICRQIYYLDYDIGELRSLVADLLLKTLANTPKESYIWLNNFNLEMLKIVRSMLIHKLIGEQLPKDTMIEMDSTCDNITKLLNENNNKPREEIQKRKFLSPERYRMEIAVQIAMGLMKNGIKSINSDHVHTLVNLWGHFYELHSDEDTDNSQQNVETITTTTNLSSKEIPRSSTFKDVNLLATIFNKLPPEHQSTITKSFTMNEEHAEDIDMRNKLNIEQPSETINTSIVQETGEEEDDDDYDLTETFKNAQKIVTDLVMVDVADDTSSELIIDLDDDNNDTEQ
ncbi:unnamed protein product [Diamesa serratosioi]